MSGKQTRRCAYNECMLPANNKKYIAQLCYLIISVIFLISAAKEFTFFSILMYSAPILLDLIYVDLNGKLYNGFKKIFLVLNIAIVLFCLLGLIGVFVDKEDSFAVVNSMLIFPGAEFNKKLFLIPMLAELVVPLLLYSGCPNKESNAALEYALNRKVGNT